MNFCPKCNYIFDLEEEQTTSSTNPSNTNNKTNIDNKKDLLDEEEKKSRAIIMSKVFSNKNFFNNLVKRTQRNSIQKKLQSWSHKEPKKISQRIN